MNATERFAVDYLRKCVLRAERFTKAETRHCNAPDFRVFHGDDLLLYCEAKHVQQDEWLDERLRYIGIDYSGAQTPSSRLKGLRVYAAGLPVWRISVHETLEDLVVARRIRPL
jgi:hypothetical protein